LVIAAGELEDDVILDEIKNPVLDINLQEIYDKLKVKPGDTEIRANYLDALRIASKKIGQAIRK